MFKARLHCDIRISPSDKSPWSIIHATAVGAFAEANTIEKVRAAEGAWNSGDTVAGARRDAERDIRGFALRLVEEGNWDVVGSQSPRTVDSGHDEPSTRSMR